MSDGVTGSAAARTAPLVPRRPAPTAPPRVRQPPPPRPPRPPTRPATRPPLQQPQPQPPPPPPPAPPAPPPPPLQQPAPAAPAASTSGAGAAAAAAAQHVWSLTKQQLAGLLGTAEQQWAPVAERLARDAATPLERTRALTRLVHRHGVPEHVRARFWLCASGAGARQAAAPPGVYAHLVARAETVFAALAAADATADASASASASATDSSPGASASASATTTTRTGAARGGEMYVTAAALASARQIERDVARTAGGAGVQTVLRRVLGAYSCYNARVGYCQAMHRVAALFLAHGAAEESAFWLLATTVERVLPRDYYTDGMAGVHADVQTCATLAHTTLPRLAMRLDAAGVRLDAFLSAWLPALFIGTMPPAAVARVLDLVYYDGSHMLFQVALGLLHTLESGPSSSPSPSDGGSPGGLGTEDPECDAASLMARVQGLPGTLTDAHFAAVVFAVAIPPREQIESLRAAFRTARATPATADPERAPPPDPAPAASAAARAVPPRIPPRLGAQRVAPPSSPT